MLILACCGIELFAQAPHVQLENEAELSLSLYQECEEAMSRAKRWLASQPRREEALPKAASPEAQQAHGLMLYLEALARDSEPIALEMSWMLIAEELVATLCAPSSPLEARFQTFHRALLEETFESLPAHPMEVALYLMMLNQRSFEARQALQLPDNWRRQCALKMVNAQRCNGLGGFWQAAPLEPAPTPTLQALTDNTLPHDPTLWALVVLREMMSKHPKTTLKSAQTPSLPQS
jgi:hypothetical protein